jgi:hypothetical protein
VEPRTATADFGPAAFWLWSIEAAVFIAGGEVVVGSLGIDAAPLWFVAALGDPVLIGALVGLATRRLRPETRWTLAAVMAGAIIGLQCLAALPDNLARGCLRPNPPHPTTDWCLDQGLELLLAPYVVAALAFAGLVLGQLRAPTRNAGWQPSPLLLGVPMALALVPLTIGSAAELIYQVLGQR